MSQESELTEKPGEVPSSVPEIYFDLIARVIPGAIAIAVYRDDLLTVPPNTLTIGFGLICSYLAGMVLHIVSDALWHLFFYFWQPRIAKHCKFLRLNSDTDLLVWIRESLTLVDRNLFTKMMAEKAMFRSVSIIAAFAIFCPPALIRTNYKGPAWHITLPAFVLLALCMFTVHKWLTWNKDHYEALKSKERHDVRISLAQVPR